ncbi:MAG TPA: tyrosine-type recombinase/integrase [Rhodoferax sp.]
MLVLSLVLGMGINFSRSAIYQATARVQITPPGKVVTGVLQTAGMNNEAKQAVSIEMELLNSRPLIEKAAEKLRSQGLLKTESDDPVQTLQDMLKLTNVEDTPVVRLQAQGHQKNLVAPLLNTLLAVYQAQQAAAGDSNSQTQLAAAQEELNVIEAKVAEKQRALEELRLHSNIVSGERDENQTLATLKGLSTSLATATDREATAAGRVRSIEQAITEGKRAPQAKDNPTVAAIEARLSQAREDWRALERQFTPQYLNMDPDAIAMKARIANLEQQLEAERQKAQQMALADAREELASARATAQSLQQRMSDNKQEVNTFSLHLGQFQSLQEQLKSLAVVRNTAAEKLLALQATETARKPHIAILEPAVMPDGPSQPPYWRDAGLVVLTSIVLSFLSVWFVEFFNRKETIPDMRSTVVLPQPWTASSPALAHLRANAEATGHLSHQPQPIQPALQWPVNPLPRELDTEEVQQLLHAATPKNLRLLTCLLCGLSAEEVVSLQWQHLDTSRHCLKVPGQASREIPLNVQLRDLVDAAGADGIPHVPSDPLFTHDAGNPLDAADVQAIVTSSAFDADLSDPQSVTPESLRHTYVAFLVRQGLRFSELGSLVGRLSADTLKALVTVAQGAPTGPRVGVAEVQQLLPPLR